MSVPVVCDHIQRPLQHFWTVALSIGGVGAIGAFVFWSLYKGWLRLGIFAQLTSAQTFKLMVVFLVLTFVFCSAALVGFLFGAKPAPDKSSYMPLTMPLTVESLKNASYTLDANETITLQEGVMKFEGPPETHEYLEVTLVKWAFGNLKNDVDQDAAVVLNSTGGGSGWFPYVVPVINMRGAAAPLRAFPLGDRNVFKNISIANRIVTVEYLTHGNQDPSCCPSVLSTIRLTLAKDGFECADQVCRDTIANDR